MEKGEKKEREVVKRLQHYVWRAPSIKQVFEKGRQREKVSTKYLKECWEERGARPEGDKAVSRTPRQLLCHWIRLPRHSCVSLLVLICAPVHLRLGLALLTFQSGLPLFTVQRGRWQRRDGRCDVWRLPGEPSLACQHAGRRPEPQRLARLQGRRRINSRNWRISVPMCRFFKLLSWDSKHPKMRGCFESDFETGLYLYLGNHPQAILQTQVPFNTVTASG